MRERQERQAVARRYDEHLTDGDLLALADGRTDQVAVLRREPELVLDLLDRPAVADGLLAPRHDEPERFRHVSPFLVLAAAVHRTANSLVGARFVTDRTGPRTRLPLLDGPALAAFAAAPGHRLFLTELLSSYTRLGSGRTWQRSERGRWRRQRWDELDLPRLAGLLDELPPEQRPGLWRRIGDGALFLASVFPEYAERHLGLVEIARLHNATGLRLSTATAPVPDLLDELARRAYEWVGAAVPREVVDSPGYARRVLALVADRYLFPAGGPAFGDG